LRGIAFAGACALALTVCGREPTGPEATAASGGMAMIAVGPGFDEGTLPRFQATGVPITHARLVLRDSEGRIVVDEIVPFPDGQQSVSITASVPVRGESERYTARFELRNGTTVMFEGTQEVVVRAGASGQATSVVPQTFVGPGSTAARVVVSASNLTLLAGASLQFTASAVDASGAAIPGALLVWSSSNPNIASVSNTGMVTAGNARGSAAIVASTVGGVSGSAIVNVTLPAARIVVEGGDGQPGRAGTQLPLPFRVQVQASDGVGIPNAAVAFSTTSQGATITPATATTDANGRASATMTLGGALGNQTFRAAAGAFNTSVTAVASAGFPAAITLVSGDAQIDSIARPLAQPFVVRVADSFGNPTPGATV
jgi:adhesin/invasin